MPDLPGVDDGGNGSESTTDRGLLELVEEIVAAARLLLLNIRVDPFDVAGVSVEVKTKRVFY